MASATAGEAAAADANGGVRALMGNEPSSAADEAASFAASVAAATNTNGGVRAPTVWLPKPTVACER